VCFYIVILIISETYTQHTRARIRNNFYCRINKMISN